MCGCCLGVASDYLTDLSLLQLFVSQRTGISVEVVRPSIFRTWWWPFVAVGILVAAGYAGFKVVSSKWFQRYLEPIGIVASLLVFWFATSGGLFNVIRGLPMYYVDQNE